MERRECSCKADAKGVRQFNAEVIEMHHTEEEKADGGKQG